MQGLIVLINNKPRACSCVSIPHTNFLAFSTWTSLWCIAHKHYKSSLVAFIKLFRFITNLLWGLTVFHVAFPYIPHIQSGEYECGEHHGILCRIPPVPQNICYEYEQRYVLWDHESREHNYPWILGLPVNEEHSSCEVFDKHM